MRAGFFPGVYRIVDELMERHQLVTNDARLVDDFRAELAATVREMVGDMFGEFVAEMVQVEEEKVAA
jgi:hypothetical protein